MTLASEGVLYQSKRRVRKNLIAAPFVNNKRLVQFDYADLSTDKTYDVELNEGVVALFTKV